MSIGKLKKNLFIIIKTLILPVRGCVSSSCTIVWKIQTRNPTILFNRIVEIKNKINHIRIFLQKINHLEKWIKSSS